MSDQPDAIQFQLTEALWEDMQALEGQPIASLVVWDSSLVDDSLESPVADEARVYVDCELYLANQTLLELYGVAVAHEDAEEPLVGLAAINQALEQLADDGAFLLEIASDQDDGLVLTIGNQAGQNILLAVTAWLESTWDTLPEETYT